jgi:hypothetical protein
VLVISFVTGQKFLTRQSNIRHQAKRGKNLNPRKRKACHSMSTVLMQSIAEIGTQSAMKSSKKTLHELSPYIPKKASIIRGALVFVRALVTATSTKT